MEVLKDFVLPILLALIGSCSGCLVANKNVKEGLRCMLRSQITEIYYSHYEDKTLREYERKNLDRLHAAYKALKGNSFVDDIYAEMRKWAVIQ